LPESLIEGLLEELRSSAEEPTIELKTPVIFNGINGEFRLAVPLFVDGNLRYLLLHQLEEHLSNAHKSELAVLASHLQRALETENRHRALLEMAHRDPLTGIYNRRYFEERLHQELNRFQRFAHGQLAVMVIRLDEFDKLNAQHGHADTDRVLQAVADAIHHKLRSYDVLARYEGDKFIALLPSVKNGQVNNVSTRVQTIAAELQSKHEDSETYKQLNFSIGVSVTESSTETTPDELVKEAKKALGTE